VRPFRDTRLSCRYRAIVSSAPKAEVTFGRGRFDRATFGTERALKLVGCRTSYRITTTAGYVTVSAGGQRAPLATGVTSKNHLAALPSSPGQPAAAAEQNWPPCRSRLLSRATTQPTRRPIAAIR